MRWSFSYCIIFRLLQIVVSDLYVHAPRGCNNRLNEQTTTRTNGNRLFDSQNNARGGYNVGDSKSTASRSENDQYRMNYFQSGYVGDTELTIEWTNQHGCGGNEDTSPHKLNCNLVLQFMCQDDITTAAPDDSKTYRNGQQTATQDFTASNNDNDAVGTVVARRNANVRADRGLHESWEWYDSCNRRERNKNLFTADQELKGTTAIYTRQNSQGTRRGYECPEERDYYPYFHPTPWIDIAVLANNLTSCDFYRKNSFNSHVYGECVEKFTGTNQRKHWSKANHPSACSATGGEWVEYHNFLELAPSFKTQEACLKQNSLNNSSKFSYQWGKPYDVSKIIEHQIIKDVCFVAPPKVDCKDADWSRVNHLGNGRDLTPLNYTWILPHFPSGKKKRCVLRMRYNITTDDYDPFTTSAKENQKKVNNVVERKSPIENNPLVDIEANQQPLRLAINTAQTGRVFQDRTHVFHLSPRGKIVPDDKKILNLNVRGKRGNIVQVYPAVEYDFIPNRLTMTEENYLHIQWTGSNTHNNNGNGGDGQAGDDGEGKGGSDRNNILQMNSPGENFPTIYTNASLFKNLELVWNPVYQPANNLSPEQKRKIAAIQLASSGYYHCETAKQCGGNSMESKAALTKVLDNAPATFRGLIAKIKKGKYYYMCTRNNNFSNRSQKGHILVN